MMKYVIGAGALAAILSLGNGIRMIGAVSEGSPIGTRPNSALLLIDLQTVFWDDGPYDDEAKARARAIIEQEVADMKADGGTVIAIRQEWSQLSTKLIARLTMGGKAVEGQPGNEIAAPFAGLADRSMVKRVQDAFETGELDSILKELDVGSLRIVGLDLNYCVGKTALAARRRGYDVEINTGAALASAPAEKMKALLAAEGISLK